ncbi:MAG: hypothetical protein J6V93_03340 [Clostridia bacterium]|nr:hypothetical protein [Clostridia bacterium]
MKNTRRALLLSVVSMFLCVVMLASTTFAWFTDSVESTGNIIKTGTLKVSMDWADGKVDPASATWTDASTGAIFNYDKWEPGYVEVRHIKIANEGTLALKYQVNIIPTGTVSELADVIDVYYLDPAKQIADREALGGVAKLATLTEAIAAMSTTATGNLVAGESTTLTIALKMQESAGNEYQNKAIGSDFRIRLLATQLTSEEDSFDEKYDVDSEYPVVVSSQAELLTAIGEGKSVVLSSDIALAADTTVTLTSGTASAIDLNGHTLTTSNTRTATNNSIIDVNGGALEIKNGTVEMAHTGTNMGWNGAATIINVSDGGVLNLKNATIKNLGGTDMNFAVHLNNWGEATLIADNCTFEAPYCAVRVFNSGPDMNNVKITNSTLKGGNVAFWVHNYTSADFGGKVYSGSNVAYDEAAVKARLNFDIYNNTNTFEKGATSTRKSAIRYGFTDSIYYDANGNIVA